MRYALCAEGREVDNRDEEIIRYLKRSANC